MTLTKEQLNAISNSFYEILSSLDPMQDPAVEQATQSAVEALDRLCLVPHAEAERPGGIV